jgi:hypothetical protein
MRDLYVDLVSRSLAMVMWLFAGSLAFVATDAGAFSTGTSTAAALRENT